MKSQARDLCGKSNNCPIDSLDHELERTADTITFSDQANTKSQIEGKNDEAPSAMLNMNDNLSHSSSVDLNSAQFHNNATMSCLLDEATVAVVPPLPTQIEEPWLKNPFCDALNSTSNAVNYWPVDLMETIKSTLLVRCPCPKDSVFIFSLDREAAKRNMCILNKYGRNYDIAIEAQGNSHLG